MDKKYFVVFIVSELYYIPVYEPVARELKRLGKPFLFLVRTIYPKRTVSTVETSINYLKQQGFEYKILEDDLSEVSSVFTITAANGYVLYDFDYKYSVLMSHGIGSKGGYFDEAHTRFDVRFVEGEYRMRTMQELYPNLETKLFNVGFAKLDQAVNITDAEKQQLKLDFNLDPDKKTILYSPTFYPSSIESIKRNFPEDLKQYNIIIKPHAFSYELDKYRKHRRIFRKWNKYDNVYLAPLEEFSLVPFMAVADIMVTDESSAMFEFVALDKPMICYRDVKLRLTYRLFPNKLKKRMEPLLDKFKDSFSNAYSYQQLLEMIEEANVSPNASSLSRKDMTYMLVGETDGAVSERIVKHLLEVSTL